MFRSFSRKDVSTSTLVKASVVRSLKTQLLQQHSNLTEDILEEILPKKQAWTQFRVGPHLTLYCRHLEALDEDSLPRDEPILYQHRDGPVLPTLRLVHQYPTVFAYVQVDSGAIPYVLGGAHVMAPGLLNDDEAEMPADSSVVVDEQENVVPGLKKGAGVAIYAFGKEHALGVGTLSMDTAAMYVYI